MFWAQSDSSSRPSPAAKLGENPVNPCGLQCRAPASTRDFCSPAIGLRQTLPLALNKFPGYSPLLAGPDNPPSVTPAKRQHPCLIPTVSVQSRCCRGCSQCRYGTLGRRWEQTPGNDVKAAKLFKGAFPRGDCRLGNSLSPSREAEGMDAQRSREH